MQKLKNDEDKKIRNIKQKENVKDYLTMALHELQKDILNNQTNIFANYQETIRENKFLK